MTTNAVFITRLMPAAIDRVFAACSRPELLSRWLVCEENGEATATSEFRVGGRFRIDMKRGSTEGEYLEIVPPRRLVFTWSAPHVGVATSVVTIELKARSDEQTEVRLTHSVDPATEAGARHARGWTTALANLNQMLKEQP
ncbi:MAG: SRPBCC domain-containing protein [Archangium sp.]|nr:SRPBCC domain-containing protein [Archangium sp.]